MHWPMVTKDNCDTQDYCSQKTIVLQSHDEMETYSDTHTPLDEKQ